MKKMLVAAALLGCLCSTPAVAHFGMIIPSDDMVMPDDPRTLTLTLSFSHPFEGVGMILEKPKAFSVISGGDATDLLSSLTAAKVMDQPAWTASFPVQRPGVYRFVVEPVPYWEPAEDVFIVHYSQTVVAAFGDDEGWDKELGLKTEIVPLTRPFGLYAGNIFQGIVKLDGKPVPNAEVEVEHYNRDGRHAAPTEYMTTQVVKADGAGVFTWGVPWEGWWGFAALNTADFTMKHEGVDKEVELGAVIWVHFEAPRMSAKTPPSKPDAKAPAKPAARP